MAAQGEAPCRDQPNAPENANGEPEDPWEQMANFYREEEFQQKTKGQTGPGEKKAAKPEEAQDCESFQ